jgi:hypothetical protein
VRAKGHRLVTNALAAELHRRYLTNGDAPPIGMKFMMQTQEFTDEVAGYPARIHPHAPVHFDLERLSIRGVYGDQLSAYRAKRIWAEAFQDQFLLDNEHDFRLFVVSNVEQHSFMLSCEFLSACGRYAFWRLTHNQAPDVQYVVETGHLPHCSVKLALGGSDSTEFDPYVPTIQGDTYFPIRPRSTLGTLASVFRSMFRRLL